MPKKKAAVIDQEQLIAVARDGLSGIAKDADIGEFHPVTEDDGVWLVQADSLQAGYPGWLWTISITAGEDGRLTVAEVNLLPGDNALRSPDWVPWSERLEEYRRLEAEREASELDDDADDADDDDGDDGDDPLDGIDIEVLDVDMDPGPLEIPDPPNDVFDHVDFDEEN